MTGVIYQTIAEKQKFGRAAAATKSIVLAAALAAIIVAAPTCAYSTVDRAYPFLKMSEGGTTKRGKVRPRIRDLT